MTDSVCITQYDMSLCTGCMACMDICPVKAISEGFTEDGFRLPKVCEEQCIKCGKCTSVCNLKTDRKKIIPQVVYRMAAKDDQIRLQCSSGGVFALLSEKIIRKGGIVIGAVFDANCKDVCHMTSEECSLEALCRSKYVQSNTIGIYQKTRQLLKANRSVLFCGTPCQIRALHSYLRKEEYTGTLVTIDFMCHGVPATMEFKDFIREREQKEKSPVVNVTFREKDNGWRKQVIKVYHRNGKIWEKKSYYYYYYYFFLKNYALRDSCYLCKEYHAHTADISLADDWTGRENDDLGTSRVFINTPLGQSTIEMIMDEVISSDITSDALLMMEIYSHSGYDYGKKQLWKTALQTGGYDKIKRTFFVRESAIPIILEKSWEAVSAIKNIYKDIRGK